MGKMKELLLKEKYRIGLLVFLLLLFVVINGQAYYSKITALSLKEKSSLIKLITPTVIQNSPTPSPTIVPSNVPKNTIVPSPTTNLSPSFSLQAFFYPGATIVSSGTNNATLTSNDDTDKITDWYSQKIRELGMNVKTTVKTKTNGNVNNKVVGAKNNTSVSITIVKEASQSITTITISLR